MPKYVIERNILDAGSLSPSELKKISQTSCGVIEGSVPMVQWVNSYVTGNKVYCIFIAPDEESVKRHGELGGFPVDSIAEVKAIIDPITAE